MKEEKSFPNYFKQFHEQYTKEEIMDEMFDRLSKWEEAYWNEILLAQSMGRQEISTGDVLSYIDSREEQDWNHAVEEMEDDGHREYETEQEIHHEYESDGSPYWWEYDVSEIGYNPYIGCFDDDC